LKSIDIKTWNRRQHFEHFKALANPFFTVTIPFNVSKAYDFSKKNKVSFFGKYLHDCMKAINDVENFRYRILDDKVVDFEVIHASATISREDHTFGFSFIEYDEDLNVFIKNLEKEKNRIQNTNELYPPKNGLDCIHCSAMPWFDFTGHKEPVSGKQESIPELAFGKVVNGRMNVAVNVNHALVDGYHVGLFAKKFQFYLNN